MFTELCSKFDIREAALNERLRQFGANSGHQLMTSLVQHFAVSPANEHMQDSFRRKALKLEVPAILSEVPIY